MRKLIKQGFCMLLAASMVLPSAACKKKDETASEKSSTATDTKAVKKTDGSILPLKKSAEFSVFVPMSSGNDMKDNKVMAKTLEAANMKFDFQSVMEADLMEKRNLLIASGDYPDMFYKGSFSMDDLDKYGKQGVLMPLEDLIDQYAPNLKKMLDDTDTWKYVTSNDGHIYSLPGIQKPKGATPDPSLWINKKWMDKLGIQEPKNLDEFYNVLKAFKEQDPNGNGKADEIPFMFTSGLKPDNFLDYFGLCYDPLTRLSVIDDKLTYVPTSDVYKKFVKYITKLYQDGLIDQSSFTQTQEQQTAKGSSGDVLGAFYDAGSFLTVGRDNDDDYITLTPFTKGTYQQVSPITVGCLTITDKCKNPEDIIAWADQFYSEEGGKLAWMGEEGDGWETNSDGTWKWKLDGTFDDASKVRAAKTLFGGATLPGVIPDFWFDKMDTNSDPEEAYLIEQKNKIAQDGKMPLPVMHYTEEDLAEITSLTTDINQYVDQYIAQIATGEKELDKTWGKYVDTIKTMGGERLMEIYQHSYDTAIEKEKK